MVAHAVRPAGRFIPARAGNTRRTPRPTASASVHPPRVRGTPRDCAACRAADRFIPARAGNTISDFRAPTTSTVHPRACGEHGARPRLRAHSDGSSPRVRGTPAGADRGRLRARFIPARAGNTSASATTRCGRPVHPRACGEHRRRAGQWPPNIGSSPRVRGTQQDLELRARRLRFIPARAGNTHGVSLHPRVSGVHPRACGEHHVPRPDFSSSPGSSPRVRGTPRQRQADGGRRRFIPARAGNTPVVEAESCSPSGSSPRVRGTRRSAPSAVGRGRFIPARAGNTVSPTPRARDSAVHPRACGEHLRVLWLALGDAGSSPRVRGTQMNGHLNRFLLRFIPARAGNTAAGR